MKTIMVMFIAILTCPAFAQYTGSDVNEVFRIKRVYEKEKVDDFYRRILEKERQDANMRNYEDSARQERKARDREYELARIEHIKTRKLKPIEDPTQWEVEKKQRERDAEESRKKHVQFRDELEKATRNLDRILPPEEEFDIFYDDMIKAQ